MWSFFFFYTSEVGLWFSLLSKLELMVDGEFWFDGSRYALAYECLLDTERKMPYFSSEEKYNSKRASASKRK